MRAPRQNSTNVKQSAWCRLAAGGHALSFAARRLLMPTGEDPRIVLAGKLLYGLHQIVFELVEEGFVRRLTAFGEHVPELFNELPLLPAHLAWRLNLDVDDQVAAAAAVDAGRAAAAQAKRFAGLHALGDFQPSLAIQRIDLDLNSESAWAMLRGTVQCKSSSWRSKIGCGSTLRKTYRSPCGPAVDAG